jgi:hypothetical protein
MNIAGIHTTKPRTQRYVDAFVSGTPGPYKIYDFKTLKGLPEEDLIMYGILAGSGEVYKRCEAANKDFYYMDHGYFGNAHDAPHWLRITKNGHTQTTLKNVPTDRYEKHFKRELKPWNKTGKDILFLPPTIATSNFFNATNWIADTLKTLSNTTDRYVDIREKPYNPNISVDQYGATVKVDRPTEHKGPIDWSQYHAVITFNSNTMIEALHNGVPVFCGTQASAALPISETDFTKIETPKYGDRMALFASLAYSNFTMAEMADGTAWKILNES